MTQDVSAARVGLKRLAKLADEAAGLWPGDSWYRDYEIRWGQYGSIDAEDASFMAAASPTIVLSLLARVAALEEGMRLVTMQDVRLRVGEGKLSAADVLAGVNAELGARRSRADFFASHANKSPGPDVQKMQNSDSQKGGGA